jgi:hypothetical protein
MRFPGKLSAILSGFVSISSLTGLGCFQYVSTIGVNQVHLCLRNSLTQLEVLARVSICSLSSRLLSWLATTFSTTTVTYVEVPFHLLYDMDMFFKRRNNKKPKKAA